MSTRPKSHGSYTRLGPVLVFQNRHSGRRKATPGIPEMLMKKTIMVYILFIKTKCLFSPLEGDGLFLGPRKNQI